MFYINLFQYIFVFIIVINSDTYTSVYKTV